MIAVLLALALAQLVPEELPKPEPMDALEERVEHLEAAVEEHKEAAEEAAGEVEKLLQALGYEDLEEAVEEHDAEACASGEECPADDEADTATEDPE